MARDLLVGQPPKTVDFTDPMLRFVHVRPQNRCRNHAGSDPVAERE